MPEPKPGPSKSAPKKRTVARGVTSAHRVRRGDTSWFLHPEMQARIAEAEADLLNGRSSRTDSPEAAQAILDSWKS